MVCPYLVQNNVRNTFVENKTMTARDLPSLNNDIFYLLLSKVIELEDTELKNLQDVYNGRMTVTQKLDLSVDASVLQKLIKHTQLLYRKSILNIGWLHDAKQLYHYHWSVANKFNQINLRRWCEGCGKEYFSRTFTPAELKNFLHTNWKCNDGCICEEYFSGLNWCIDCRYGTHDFIPSDEE